ncbi:MAG: hypothetical protein NVS1B4_12190 [Gemmatimonadaceae bacterium]
MTPIRELPNLWADRAEALGREAPAAALALAGAARELDEALRQALKVTESAITAIDWREKLWQVHAETRIGVAEVAEALGYSIASVYKRTSPASGLAQIPHAKMGGGFLRFRVAEVRQYVHAQEGRTTPTDFRALRVRRRLPLDGG